MRYLFNYIKNKNRFILDKHGEEICSALLTIADKYSSWIKKGDILYRCQKGCNLKEVHLQKNKSSWQPQPFGDKRMKPLCDKAKEGRVNPKGIPCLYLAKTELTAIQEMQPLPKELLTVAEFFATKDLRIVNCFGKINDDSNNEDWFWTIWGYEFSRPVQNFDDRADYAPTQYLASRFESLGFHGIAYKSCFNQEINYAIFNPKDFQFKSSKVKCIDPYPVLAKESVKEISDNTVMIIQMEKYGQVFEHSDFLHSSCEFIKESNDNENT